MKRGGTRCEHTLSEDSNRPTKITCLTVYPLGVFEHSNDKTKLAKQAVFLRAIQGDMRLGQTPDRINIVHGLDHGICIRVQNVRLQPAV